MIYDWPEDYSAHCDFMRKERIEEPRAHAYEEECDLCHSTTGPMRCLDSVGATFACSECEERVEMNRQLDAQREKEMSR